jgi:drug/metabolite transporter (DMT)-like permease
VVGFRVPGTQFRGLGAAAGSAIAFGFTVVIGRALATDGLGGFTALGIRFVLGAAMLFALQAVRRGPLLPAPGERLAVIGLGAVGYAVEASFFYLGLERGTAAAVTLIFYAYPAIVTVAELVQGVSR